MIACLRNWPGLGVIALCGVVLSRPAAAEMFDGFFIGLHAGWEYNQTDLEQRIVQGGTVVERNSLSYYDGEVIWGMFLGYDWTLWDDYFLGLELSSAIGDSVIRNASIYDPIELDSAGNPTWDTHADLKIRGWSATHLRFGRKLSERLGIYGIVGISMTHYDLFQDQGASLRRGAAGLDVGLGVQYGITENLLYRLRYTYSRISDDIFYKTLNDPIEKSHRLMTGLGWAF